MDITTGAAVAAAAADAIGNAVPPSSTKNKDTYVGVLVAFKGACIGAFAEGAGLLGNNDNIGSAAGGGGGGGSSSSWGTRLVAAPVNSIVAGDAIVIAIVIVIVVVVSRDVAV